MLGSLAKSRAARSVEPAAHCGRSCCWMPRRRSPAAADLRRRAEAWLRADRSAL